MKKFCLFVVLLLLAGGCTRFSLENHSGLPITVPLAKGNKPILLSDIVDSLHYTQLETTDECLIGTINKIHLVGDRLIILDRDQTKSIYFFNKDGTFINKISRIGQGPGEYTSIGDIAINRENEEVILWASRTKKLLIYNFDGVFVNDVEFPYDARSIEYIGDDFLAVYFDYYSNKHIFKGKSTSPNLAIFNLKSREAKYDLFFDNDINTQGILIVNNNLSLFRGQALLLPTLGNSIYCISKEGIEEKYYLDFGMPFQKKIADYIKNLPNVPVQEASSNRSKSNLPFMNQIISSDKIIFLSYSCGTAYYHGFYYPESNKYLEAVVQDDSPVVINDIDSTRFFLFAADAENNFYYYLQPFRLHDRFKDSENAAIRSLIKNSKPDDNPIIVKVFMKTTIMRTKSS